MDSNMRIIEKSRDISRKLRSATDMTQASTIYVSYYVADNELKWTIRLNGIDNRVNGISLGVCFMTIKDVMANHKLLSKKSLGVRWPGIHGLNSLTKFIEGEVSSNWKATNEGIIEVAKKWEDRIRTRLKDEGQIKNIIFKPENAFQPLTEGEVRESLF
jgi:hypothetical protein